MATDSSRPSGPEADAAAFAQLRALAVEGLAKRLSTVDVDHSNRLEAELAKLARHPVEVRRLLESLEVLALARSMGALTGSCVHRGAEWLTNFALGVSPIDPLETDFGVGIVRPLRVAISADSLDSLSSELRASRHLEGSAHDERGELISNLFEPHRLCTIFERLGVAADEMCVEPAFHSELFVSAGFVESGIFGRRSHARLCAYAKPTTMVEVAAVLGLHRHVGNFFEMFVGDEEAGVPDILRQSVAQVTRYTRGVIVFPEQVQSILSAVTGVPREVWHQTLRLSKGYVEPGDPVPFGDSFGADQDEAARAYNWLFRFWVFGYYGSHTLPAARYVARAALLHHADSPRFVRVAREVDVQYRRLSRDCPTCKKRSRRSSYL